MVRSSKAYFFAVSALLLIFSAGAADSTPTAVENSAVRIPPSNTRIENVTFVVFDTETTGFSPIRDRIVEIGAVKFRNGKVLGEKTWLINPQRSIPFFVQKVHGITPEMIKDKPTFKEAYPEFAEFIKGAVLIAHNAPFDVRFMAAEMERNGCEFPNNPTIDSLVLFRKWYPKLPSHNLSVVAEAAEVTGGTFHRAEADSLYVYFIFDKQMKKSDPAIKLKDVYQEAQGTLKF